jgi:tetratricopeptide (TPR) repeat protein
MNDTSTQRSAPTGPLAQPSAAPALGMSEQHHLRTAQQKTNTVLWAIFGLLLVLVLVAIFLLPHYVQVPAPKAPVATTAPTAAPAASTTAGLTPFEEAQRLRQREAAKTTLEALLEVQAALEQKQVASWAEQAFNDALAEAKRGDEFYASQQYAKANDTYQSALSQLQKISDSQVTAFAAAMQEAAAAFAAGAATAAEAAYQRALLLQPDNAQAVLGVKRSQVLTQVSKLLNEGRNKQAAQQLEAARELYQKAQALDSANAAAATAVREINAAMAERNFSAAMSRGYAALQAGLYAEALAGFQQAQTLRPNAAEVGAAIAQVNDKQSSASVNTHMEAATKLETAENWPQAILEWNQALAVDANLVKAQQGVKRSQNREQLNQFLNATISSPLRLADDSVYQQTMQVLNDAGKLANPGPRLQDQLVKVRDFMTRVRVPVPVQIQSDGKTRVTLFHVRELGLFTSQSVSLTPGTYTAIGVRNGYRDVRQEFVVSIDGQVPVVTVTCNEAI